MMISLKTRVGGDVFYLSVDLIETITRREGNTSEIRLVNGNIYPCQETPQQIANRISFVQMSSELSKPKPRKEWDQLS